MPTILICPPSVEPLIETAAGIGAIGLPGRGTTPGMGVPAAISPSGSAREPAAGLPVVASITVPFSSTSCTRQSDHMPCAKWG